MVHLSMRAWLAVDAENWLDFKAAGWVKFQPKKLDQREGRQPRKQGFMRFYPGNFSFSRYFYYSGLPGVH